MQRQRSHWKGVTARFLSALAALSCASASVGRIDAQEARATSLGLLRGQVRDPSGLPLAGASVTLLSTRATTESDDRGEFTLSRVPVGEVLVLARRIGYAPETTLVRLAANAAPVRFVLRRVTVSLDAVVVLGRRDLRGPIAAFYERRALGNGRFFTQEQIAARNPGTMSDLLRGIPGLRIGSRRGAQSFRLRGAPVAPLVWLDGTPMGAGEVDLDSFDPRTFAAIEVYSGSATVPIEFSGGRVLSTSGGAIILWTKQGEFAEPRRRRRGELSPSLVLAGLLERGEAFTSDSVDTPARPVSSEPIRPNYPDSLLDARISGRVEVEFVVDVSGRVRMDTFGLVTTTHRSLGEAVRLAISERRWRPATRAGQPVAQLVQLPFEFHPDSGAVERKPED